MSCVSWGSNSTPNVHLGKTVSENLVSPVPVQVGTTVKRRCSVGVSGMNTHNTWNSRMSEVETRENSCPTRCRDQAAVDCNKNCKYNKLGRCRSLDRTTDCISDNGEFLSD